MEIGLACEREDLPGVTAVVGTDEYEVAGPEAAGTVLVGVSEGVEHTTGGSETHRGEVVSGDGADEFRIAGECVELVYAVVTGDEEAAGTRILGEPVNVFEGDCVS
ncbi:hypothetical protein PQI23_13835 [Leucobacter sp. USCH14]|uniref:hypothetical protein n=1 Tax=Leucobacter sp. USCH14 TaxID=3024838 RepID=UPI0030AAE4C4